MSDAPEFDTKARDRDTAIPKFEKKPVRLPDRDGKPHFEEFEFVTIFVPGDRKTEHYQRVNDEIRQRFPNQYEAWKRGLEAPTEGTPLSECAWIGRAQVEELAFGHVKTVEQLAALSDAQLKNLVPMSGYALRDKAQRHLEQINGAAPNEKLAAENTELKSNMAAMQAQMDAMMKQMAEMANAKKAAITEPAAPTAEA
jgi:hypothetical protein